MGKKSRKKKDRIIISGERIIMTDLSDEMIKELRIEELIGEMEDEYKKEIWT